MAEDRSSVVVKPDAGAPAPADGGGATPIRAGGKDYATVPDLVKAYEAANSSLGEWSSRHGDLDKKYQTEHQMLTEWNQFWTDLKPHWPAVEAMIRAKVAGRNGGERPAPAAGAESVWEGWDLLSPQEQATRLQHVVAGESTKQFNDWRAQFEQGITKQLQDKEQWYQTYLTNHLGLMRRALEQKLKNPNFDVDAVMDRAAKALSGQIDPLELGEQLLAASGSQQALEQARKEAYEQGKKDYEQELKNKQMETVPSGANAMPVFKVPVAPPGTRHGLGTMRERAAEAIVKKFGPGLFSQG